MDRAQTAIKYVDGIKSLQEAHQSLHEVELMLIEASSDLKVLTDENQSVKDLLDAKQKEIDELDGVCRSSKSDAEKLLKQVVDALKDDEGGVLRAFWASLPQGQTIEDLESDIESERARLELMHEGSGNTIREFETRRKKIESLKATLEDKNHALTELTENIANVRGHWEPELDRLVQKISDSFSYNMEQINCVGEVGIHKPDDFEDWAIHIRVKLRYVAYHVLSFEIVFYDSIHSRHR